MSVSSLGSSYTRFKVCWYIIDYIKILIKYSIQQLHLKFSVDNI
jgi:hypothetical protein